MNILHILVFMFLLHRVLNQVIFHFLLHLAWMMSDNNQLMDCGFCLLMVVGWLEEFGV